MMRVPEVGRAEVAKEIFIKEENPKQPRLALFFFEEVIFSSHLEKGRALLFERKLMGPKLISWFLSTLEL